MIFIVPKFIWFSLIFLPEQGFSQVKLLTAFVSLISLSVCLSYDRDELFLCGIQNFRFVDAFKIKEAILIRTINIIVLPERFSSIPPRLKRRNVVVKRGVFG